MWKEGTRQQILRRENEDDISKEKEDLLDVLEIEESLFVILAWLTIKFVIMGESKLLEKKCMKIMSKGTFLFAFWSTDALGLKYFTIQSEFLNHPSNSSAFPYIRSKRISHLSLWSSLLLPTGTLEHFPLRKRTNHANAKKQ